MSLDSRVQAMFAAGGVLGARWPRYEARAAQAELSAAIARTLERGGVLLAEAPTGVGKSLAYLLPSVLLALEREQRVVVATCTRSLQDQLFERDLPALFETLGVSLPCARLKGKQNYLCPRALEWEEGRAPEERASLEALRRWASRETEGDLDRFEAEDPETFRRLRPRVASDPTACTLATCRRGRECFWVRARRQASEARLLVVNHALLALAGEAQGLLPEFDVLIVDEAHRLEGVLLAQLERSVSRHRFDELFRLLGSTRGPARGRGRERGGGLLARLRAYALPLLTRPGEGGAVERIDRLARRAGEARADVQTLFETLEPPGPRPERYALRLRYRSASELLARDLTPLETVLDHCAEASRSLHRLGDATANLAGATAAELSAEVAQLASRFEAAGTELEWLVDAADSDWVYWRSASGGGVELHGVPVTAGAHARRLVVGCARATVLTSATLSSGGDFSFIAGRLGLGETEGLPFETLSVPSPFPLERQMRAFVFGGAADEAEAVADLVTGLARMTRRNQLVLFTAHERLRRARMLLLERLPAGRVLLSQEWDGPAGLLSQRFRSERGAILLGVQSLWEGVDFPGEALEILVVAKLPFSVPDDPLVEARAERLRERGLDPFVHDAVPEAVLRFRQGVGRLIRRSDDRGVLVVCDPRLRSASYRRAFLAALPVAPRPVRDASTLAEEAARFLEGEVTVEEDA